MFQFVNYGAAGLYLSSYYTRRCHKPENIVVMPDNGGLLYRCLLPIHAKYSSTVSRELYYVSIAH